MRTHDNVQQCAERLQVIADQSRLQIMCALLSGLKEVGTIGKELNVSISSVSYHIGLLREAGIVISSKRGKYVINSLHPDVHVPSADGAAEDTIVIGGLRLMIPRSPPRSHDAEEC